MQYCAKILIHLSLVNRKEGILKCTKLHGDTVYKAKTDLQQFLMSLESQYLV